MNRLCSIYVARESPHAKNPLFSDQMLRSLLMFLLAAIPRSLYEYSKSDEYSTQNG